MQRSISICIAPEALQCGRPPPPACRPAQAHPILRKGGGAQDSSNRHASPGTACLRASMPPPQRTSTAGEAVVCGALHWRVFGQRLLLTRVAQPVVVRFLAVGRDIRVGAKGEGVLQKQKGRARTSDTDPIAKQGGLRCTSAAAPAPFLRRCSSVAVPLPSPTPPHLLPASAKSKE